MEPMRKDSESSIPNETRTHNSLFNQQGQQLRSANSPSTRPMFWVVPYLVRKFEWLGVTLDPTKCNLTVVGEALRSQDLYESHQSVPISTK